MGRVSDRIEEYGKSNYKKGGVANTLRVLLKEGKTVQEIAKMFSCTVPAIRHWLISNNLLKPTPRLPRKVASLGFTSLEAYFNDAAERKRKVKDMAAELDCCYQTVSYWRNRWKRSSRKNGSSGKHHKKGD